MKKIHIICKRSNGLDLNGLLFNKNENQYISGSWDLLVADVKALIGGKLYLHETKSDLSVFGGTIISYNEVVLSERDSASKKNRINLIFIAEKQAIGIKWGGRGHTMEWTSGIINI